MFNFREASSTLRDRVQAVTEGDQRRERRTHTHVSLKSGFFEALWSVALLCSILQLDMVGEQAKVACLLVRQILRESPRSSQNRGQELETSSERLNVDEERICPGPGRQESRANLEFSRWEGLKNSKQA